MIRMKQAMVAGMLSITPLSAHANDTATGDLEVRAVVGAVCKIEGVSDLVLDLEDETGDSFGNLDTSTMSFDVVCSGSPTVSQIAFTSPNVSTGPVFKLSDDNGNKIDYKIFAELGDVTDFSNSIPLSPFSNTVDVSAEVQTQQVSVGAAATGNPGPSGSTPSSLKAGEYSDTVTITVSYQ